MKFIRHKQPQTTRIYRMGRGVEVVPGGLRGFETGEEPPTEVYTFEIGLTYEFEDGTERELEQQH